MIERLLDRLKNGDQAAFDTVFRAHYPALVILAQSLLHDRSASEDVVQEVMLELWRRRTTVTIQESLRAYLVRSTRNRALNQIRHANVQKRAEPHLIGEESVAAAGTSGLVAAELRDAITDRRRRAAARLPRSVSAEPGAGTALRGDRRDARHFDQDGRVSDGKGAEASAHASRGVVAGDDGDLSPVSGGWIEILFFLLTPRRSGRQTQGGRRATCLPLDSNRT